MTVRNGRMAPTSHKAYPRTASTGPSSRYLNSMRRHLDQYFTPKWATHVLLQHQKIAGNIIEPCSGAGDIADPLRAVGNVSTNDLDQSLSADSYVDAASPLFWESVPVPDW